MKLFKWQRGGRLSLPLKTSEFVNFSQSQIDINFRWKKIIVVLILSFFCVAADGRAISESEFHISFPFWAFLSLFVCMPSSYIWTIVFFIAKEFLYNFEYKHAVAKAALEL